MSSNKISIPVAMAVGLGAIIGAGIFALSGSAIAYAGSEAIIAFLMVGVLVIMIAFQTSELGSIMPRAKGTTYSYVYNAFGSELGFITGIIYYFSIATSIATIALSFGAYFISTIFQVSNSATITSYEIIPAIVLIAILAIVNLFGIRKAVRADFVFVVTKVVILLIFIGFAIYIAFVLGQFNPNNFAINTHNSSGTQSSGLGGIFLASTAIIFAYSGFQVISTFTSRIKDGAKGAAKAIIGSVLISIILYLSVIIALLLLRPASAFNVTGDPLVATLFAVNAPSVLIILVGLGALVATTSATLAIMLGGSRTLYQISEDKLLPGILNKFSKKRDVAYNGVIVTAAIAIITLFVGNLYIIAAISNFGLLFSWLMTSLAVLHFRRIKKYGDFRTPLFPYVPLISIVAVLIFMATLPSPALPVGITIVLSLIVIYYAQREIDEKKVVKVKLFN